jgi:multiple sugar transport system permease protein
MTHPGERNGRASDGPPASSATDVDRSWMGSTNRQKRRRPTAARRSSLAEENDTLLGYIFTGPSLVILAVMLFIPMGYSIALSLFRTSMANSIYTFVGFRGFLDALMNGDLWRIVINSVAWTAAVVAGQLVIGMAGAMLLADPFPGRWLVRSLVILPWVIPGVVAALMWRLIYDAQLGLLNAFLTKIGLMQLAREDWLGDPNLALWATVLTGIWKGFPFSMVMCLAALQNVPRELYEAADMDGARPFQKFRYVTVPSISDVVRTVALLISIWTFNYFEIIWVLTRGGPVGSTHIFPTFIYQISFRNFDYGEASRFAVISFVIVSGFSLLYIRRLRSTRQI